MLMDTPQNAIPGSSAPRSPYRLAITLVWGAAVFIVGAPAFGQTITTVPTAAPATVAPVPTGGAWMLALLAGLLAAAGFWAIRSGRAHRVARSVCGLVVLTAGLIGAGYNPAVRAALAPWLLSFTQASGETMDIPILPSPAEGAPTDFAPVQFTNASGSKLRIAAITRPAGLAACFPLGVPDNLPATPLPIGATACAVDLQLDDHASCVVDVAGMCAQGVTTISLSPETLAFDAGSAGTITVTANPGSSQPAQEVTATLPPGSHLAVQSSTCGASLAPGSSCTITLASSAAEGPTSVAVAGTNTNTHIASVNVTPTPTYTIGGTISGLLGGALTLQSNGADSLTQCSNTPFTFSTPIAAGSSYNVTVFQQPAGQICSVSNSSGTVSDANITNVVVSCVVDPASAPATKLQGWGC